MDQTLKRTFLIPVVGLLGVCCLGIPSIALPETAVAERIEWTKTPIKLTLSVDQERQIHFPAPVRVGVPLPIEGSLRTQSVDGTVYLLAYRPFDTTRVMVRETESGRTYLFDIRAAEPSGIKQPREIFITNPSRPAELISGSQANEPSETFDYVRLTRFAAQQLYAPRRLMQALPNLSRVPVTDAAVALVRGGAVKAIPLIAWSANGRYVTAVKLTNTTNQPVVLDPRRLRGRWLAATFQHARLFPRGDEADTTCVYLISARRFEASL